MAEQDGERGTAPCENDPHTQDFINRLVPVTKEVSAMLKAYTESSEHPPILVKAALLNWLHADLQASVESTLSKEHAGGGIMAIALASATKARVRKAISRADAICSVDGLELYEKLLVALGYGLNSMRMMWVEAGKAVEVADAQGLACDGLPLCEQMTCDRYATEMNPGVEPDCPGDPAMPCEACARLGLEYR